MPKNKQLLSLEKVGEKVENCVSVNNTTLLRFTISKSVFYNFSCVQNGEVWIMSKIHQGKASNIGKWEV